MDDKVPQYPMIILYCSMIGSHPYYANDETERAKSVNAPRDTYAAGRTLNEEIQIKRWSEMKNEEMKETLAAQCEKRFGVHPKDLLEV